MNIRVATHQDTERLAMVHVNSWKTTYQGIIPEAYLSNLSVEGRKKNWGLIFKNPNQDETIYVIEDGGKIIGFIDGGKNRELGMDYDAEIYSFYLLKEVQGRGYGKLLFNRLVKKLRSDNYNSLMVWVLERNPSIGFYEKMGGEYITKKEIKIGEQIVIETAFEWKDLGAMSL
ncbi:N-acetyltransferase family protein [Paenibacillus sp. B1-33]|uniref:GNAT family N-acetyltransferase n=1 Tax=unclassified Paenibacillus TaxID=185978 RepID=UPI003D2A95C4